MKTAAIILLIILATMQSASTQPATEDLRNRFFAMHDEKCGQLKFFESIQSDHYTSATHQAYAGTAEAASAECASGPRGKLRYFNRGKANIEEAVSRQPDNPEIRFMRFATQANIPSFLFYDNIKEDKALIIDQLPALLGHPKGRNFWIRVADFMIKSGKLSSEEENKINKWIEIQQ